MATKKSIIGQCRLCGKNKELNYEHVPPRTAFNATTKFKTVPFDQYLSIKNPSMEKLKVQTQQGGIGFYCFCQNCNNFLGSKYVRPYKDWVLSGFWAISQGNFLTYEYSVSKQRPNLILKQIISMFLAINEYWFAKEYSELVQFVNDPKSTNLNDRFRIYTYLNTVGQRRYIPWMVQSNLTSSEPLTVCEIAFPPFGYVLTIDQKRPINGLLEITSFKTCPAEKEVTVDISIPKHETHLPFPLDYRTKEQLDRTM